MLLIISDDHLPLPPDYTVDTNLPCFSQDHPSNNYGRDLLDLCWASRIHLVSISSEDLVYGLTDSPFGFCCGLRATDPTFILNVVVKCHVWRRKPLYASFVDFLKAFDSVDHSLVWSKLANLVASSGILALYSKSMYSKGKSVLCMEKECSEKFPCRRGVCQGCNLSPLLFSLYIMDLEK